MFLRIPPGTNFTATHWHPPQHRRHNAMDNLSIYRVTSCFKVSFCFIRISICITVIVILITRCTTSNAFAHFSHATLGTLVDKRFLSHVISPRGNRSGYGSVIIMVSRLFLHYVARSHKLVKYMIWKSSDSKHCFRICRGVATLREKIWLAFLVGIWQFLKLMISEGNDIKACWCFQFFTINKRQRQDEWSIKNIYIFLNVHLCAIMPSVHVYSTMTHTCVFVVLLFKKY